jgi:hypothetical protein
MRRVWLAFVYLAAALVAFQMWRQYDDLWWTVAASGFALASIRETLLFVKTLFRQ